MELNPSRRDFAAGMGVIAGMAPLAGMLGSLAAPGQAQATVSVDDPTLVTPYCPRTPEEAQDFLYNQQRATEDYVADDGTVIPAIYLDLRNRWNRLGLGNGSAVDDGSSHYWDLMRYLFTEEEAAKYMELPIYKLFTANDYHAVSGRPEEECAQICDDFARKGVLPRFVRAGVPYYYLTNQLLGQPMYYDNPEFMANLGNAAPDATRLQYDQGTPTYQVSPVSVDVVAETEILPYDDWRATIERNEKFVVTPCVCRSMQATFSGDTSWMDDMDARYDDGTGNPLRIHTCLAMGELAEYYAWEGYGKEISKDEAFAIVEQSADEDMVIEHFYGKGSEVICQCHVDTCFLLGALRAMNGQGDAVVAMSNYNLELDKDACIKCGACVDRCTMHSVTMGEDGYPQMDAACARCGQCAVTCPAAARTLVAKAPEDQLVLPDNLLDDWYEKAKYRAEKGTIYDFVG